MSENGQSLLARHDVMDDVSNLSTRGTPLSQRETTTVTPGNLNVPIIVTGVFVPLILIVVIVVIIYVWYRRKYPVRMVIGKDFSRFSNPAYNKRASTMTLVRADASVDIETNEYDNEALAVVREDDTDGTDVEVVTHDTVKGDSHRAVVNTKDDGSRAVEGVHAKDIVRDRPKRAMLIKDNVEELDKDFDLVTESDLSQRTESEVSSGNDSTETHTISLNFAETFDFRHTLSRSVNDLSTQHVPKPSKSKSFGERSAPVDFDKLTENLSTSQPVRGEINAAPFQPKDGTRAKSLNGDKQVVFSSTLTPKQDDLGLNGTQKTSSENVATFNEDDDCSSESNDSIGQKTKLRDSRILSMDSLTNNTHEFKIDPKLLSKKRLSLTMSTEKIFLENDPATPTVIVPDSIIYEPDSTSPVQLDTSSTTREKRSVTLGDMRPTEDLRLPQENMREWHSVGGFESDKTSLFAGAEHKDSFKQPIGTNQKLDNKTIVPNEAAENHLKSLPSQGSEIKDVDFKVTEPADSIDVPEMKNNDVEDNGTGCDLMLSIDPFEIPNEHSKGSTTDPPPVSGIESAGSLDSNELQKSLAQNGDLSRSANVLDVYSPNLENSSTDTTKMSASLVDNIGTFGYTATAEDDFILSDMGKQGTLVACQDTKDESMDKDAHSVSSLMQEKSHSERLKCISEGEEPGDSPYNGKFQNANMSEKLIDVSSSFAELNEDDDAPSVSENEKARSAHNSVNCDEGEKGSMFGDNDDIIKESQGISSPDNTNSDLASLTQKAEEIPCVELEYAIEDERPTSSMVENIKQELESENEFVATLDDTCSSDNEVDC